MIIKHIIYKVYKHLIGREKTCKKFGHDFIYPPMGGLPPMKCYCRCCKRRWEIDWKPNFLTEGVDLKEVKEFSNKTLTDEYIEENWR